MNLERLHLDRNLIVPLLILGAISVFAVYSGSGGDLGTAGAHIVRLGIGFVVLLVFAQIPPDRMERWSPVVFGLGLALVVAVLVAGVVAKGAQRWLTLGFLRFQPSEIMKLAVPMTVSWLFARHGLPPSGGRLLLGFVLAVVPAGLIALQPDLGTAILVAGGGIFVLFLAGMPARIIFVLMGLAAAAAPIGWSMLHEYQKRRIYTLLDPEADPLGAGYHTLQSMIAVGSGGIYGKGWTNSSQAHLEYLPESHTDFIFAVYSEEFGLIGAVLLVVLYLFIVYRSMMIAHAARDTYSRLLAGCLSLTFFLYVFVNMGMVVGILPIVGVPLPLMSYGGTSIVTVMASFGIIMSIHTHRRMAES